MRKLFSFLALAAVVGSGAIAQTWELNCTPDERVGTLTQFIVRHVNCHMNVDPGNNSHTAVWSWNGTEEGIAWLEDYPNSGAGNIGELDVSSLISGRDWRYGMDIVLTSDYWILVVAVDSNHTSEDMIPWWMLFEYNSGTNEFDYVDDGPIDNSFTEAHWINMDINDGDSIVVTWEDNGSIYANSVASYGGGGVTWNGTETIQAAAGNTAYRFPDITIHTAGMVSIVYIDTTTGNPDELRVEQDDYSDLEGLSWGPANNLNPLQGSGHLSMNTPPRIASPNANVACSTDCDDDYVAVVNDYDGTYWYILAANNFEGSDNTQTVNHQPGNSTPDIRCYPNWRPVVAWPDGGVVVMWTVGEADGTGGCDDISGTPPCVGGAPGPSFSFANIVVEFLDDELVPLNTDDVFSVFHWIQYPRDIGFMQPAISDGEGANIGSVDVLYSGHEAQLVPITPGPDAVIYKSQAFGNLNLKRGRIPPGFLTEKDVYPNPFTDHVVIPSESVPVGLIAWSLHDVSGRAYSVEAIQQLDGSMVVSLPDPNSLAAGLYLLRMAAADDRSIFKLMKEQ